MKKNENILKEILEKSNPSEEDIKHIKKNVREFCEKIKKEITMPKAPEPTTESLPNQRGVV